MKKESIIYQLLTKFLKKIGVVKEVKIDKSVMCRRAVESGVCPNCCEKCAWSESVGD